MRSRCTMRRIFAGSEGIDCKIRNSNAVGNFAGCVVADVGPNLEGSRVKNGTIASASVACPRRIDRTNWLGIESYSDYFTVMQTGCLLSVTRGDPTSDNTEFSGWVMDLRFLCCPASTVHPSARPSGLAPTHQICGGGLAIHTMLANQYAMLILQRSRLCLP
jgi:hypothetical protein